MRRFKSVITLFLVFPLSACLRNPAAPPLTGTVAPSASLPRLELASGHRQSAFRWEYEDADMAARGEGAVRIAPPDSARLDLFFAGGMGSGAAVLVGDTLRTPGAEMIRRYLPPPPMLWAAFGRLVIPPARDTVVTVDGDVMRADVGRPAEWRVTVREGQLRRLEHLQGGRITETVARDASGSLVYEMPSARRKLTLHMTSTREVQGFDASIWRF